MTDAVFIEEGTLPDIRKFATPFDGIRGPTDAEAYYQPLSSFGDEVYLAETTHDGVNLVSWLARLRKSDYTEIQSRKGIGQQTWATGTGTAVAGHASATSGVNSNGTVWARRGGHTQPLDSFYTATPGDIATLSGLVNPAGGDVRADYRRAWRAPNGTLWVYYRGNDGKGEFYSFDDATNTLTRVGSPFLDFGVGMGHYGIKLVFASDGTMYASVEVNLTDTSGFPCHTVGAIKSVDGLNWTNLSGTVITLPVDQSDVTLVAGGTIGDQVVMAQMALDQDDNPVMAFGWTRPVDDQYLATYVARWQPLTSDFSYVRLYPEIGDGTDVLGQWQNSKIIPHMLFDGNGNVLIIMKEIGSAVSQNLVALTNLVGEPEENWHRWVLHAGDLYTGAYVDYNSLSDDGLFRIYPVTSGDLVGYNQISEIWEVRVPGFNVWGNRVEVDSIIPTTYTLTPADPDKYYRVRVRTRDTTTGEVSDYSDYLVIDPFESSGMDPILLGSGSLNDQIMAGLVSQGFTTGSIADRERARLLAKLGFVSTIAGYSLHDLYIEALEPFRIP